MDHFKVNTNIYKQVNLLNVEIVNKSTNELINSYMLQLEPMTGSQTKIEKEVDGGDLKIIQTKSPDGFKVDVIVCV